MTSNGYWIHLVWNRANAEGRDDYPLSGGDGISSEVPHSNHREELSAMLSEDDGSTWSRPIVIARVTPESRVPRLAYPRVFEANPGELWVTTTYADFSGYLSVRLLERDLRNGAQ